MEGMLGSNLGADSKPPPPMEERISPSRPQDLGVGNVKGNPPSHMTRPSYSAVKSIAEEMMSYKATNAQSSSRQTGLGDQLSALFKVAKIDHDREGEIGVKEFSYMGIKKALERAGSELWTNSEDWLSFGSELLDREVSDIRCNQFAAIMAVKLRALQEEGLLKVPFEIVQLKFENQRANDFHFVVVVGRDFRGDTMLAEDPSAETITEMPARRNWGECTILDPWGRQYMYFTKHGSASVSPALINNSATTVGDWTVRPTKGAISVARFMPLE